VQLTLVLPSQLVAVQLPTRARIIKTIYERIPVAGVFLGEISVMAALGSAHGTALVFSFDGEIVEIAAVNDFSLIPSAVESCPVDSKAIFEAIKCVLVASVSSMSDDGSLSLSASIQEAIKKDAVAGTKEFLSALSFAADRKSVLIADEVPLSIEPFVDALMGILVDSCPSVIDVVCSVLSRVESERRSIVLNHVIVSGECVSLELVSGALHHALTRSSGMAVSDYSADTQPTLMAFRGIPDYYHEIKNSAKASIAWFGATLAGKYAFADSKTFIPPSKN
jgi:hypothetical protein